MPPANISTKFQPNQIPQELIALPQWVIWKPELRDGKWTKVPYCPGDPLRKAKTNDPSTWGTYQEAIKAASESDGTFGIGFVFTEDDPHSGVDLDHVREPETGAICEWAQEIIQSLNSYTEVSPSGTGVKIFCQSKKPGNKSRRGNVEMYDCLCPLANRSGL